MKDSRENDRSDIVKKSSILDMLDVAFDFDSEAILLGYLRYAEHNERLYRHLLKMKNSSLPAIQTDASGRALLFFGTISLGSTDG